jgi:nucleotidyltransferase substrate binding protein (TIGR01987 family)
MKMEQLLKNIDVRWLQRFDNFTKAYSLLSGATDSRDISTYDDLQQEGIIQRFEYTFELLWKTIKDFLQEQSVDIGIISPKNVIKAAARSGLLEQAQADGQILLDALESRNLITHTYDNRKFKEILVKIQANYLPEIKKMHDYFLTKAQEFVKNEEE